jgi:hypothetical protein
VATQQGHEAGARCRLGCEASAWTGPAGHPLPDYVADAKAAQDIAEWRQVWQRAKDAGHLDNALKAKLTPIGEADLLALVAVYEAKPPAHRAIPAYLVREYITGERAK